MYATVSRPPLADRLNEQIKALRTTAERLPPGPERDGLLDSIERDEIALRVIQWMTSSGDLPPPSDLIPMKRHRFRRN
jgi:hypothetical protein